MKYKYMLFAILLALGVLLAACAAQDAVNAPGEDTDVPTDSTDGVTDPVGAGEAEMTPAGAVEGAGTAVIPETGPDVAGAPDSLDEVVRVLVAAGATVDLGDTVENEAVPIPGQSLLIDGEEVQIFMYESVEELEVQASELADDGNPEDEPDYYRLGTMLVRYVGNDPGVRDLLENVLGAQAAGR